ncbi:hypothetical protein RHMOL_Rhmol06G0103200 [Rhododendron molle]|uniref:Uncharacterized protein n=1 Tax=Rhododendron molle TaxID=49168 RepID=A0ACC0NAP9_RHOML|nr:hypothetical protein RHMOL_Rhmol06G0103200 [Rhododendron molle]
MAASLFVYSSHFQIVTDYKLNGPFQLSVDTVNSYVEKFWWANVAHMFGLEAAFDPSIYIISANQPKPEVIIPGENPVMFTRTVNNAKVEEIIDEEALRQVPFYFYYTLASTNDFWPLNEREEHGNEGEEPEEEEATENHPLPDVSLNLLFDEVIDAEMKVIHFISPIAPKLLTSI